MSFDLFEVPDGFETTVALVVAPYIDPNFMKKLVKQLKPKRLCLLVDDGVRQEDLDAVKAACRRNVKLEVRLGRASGLVHMKAYYLEYTREEAPRTRRRQLLFGSANATTAGFSGARNAELIANVRLAIGEDSELADYFEQILATFDTNDSVEIDEREVELSKVPTLLLPRFVSVLQSSAPSGFDTWLQRGVLAAHYRDAPQFLTVSIRLKKVLPQDMVASIFANRQFAEKTNRNLVRYGYLNGVELEANDEEEDEASRLPWKAQYAVWTHLGDWISDVCYRRNAKVMKTKSADARAKKVAELLENAENEDWKRAKREDFLDALNRVWRDLEAAGVNPADYLEGRSDGGPNLEFYADRFNAKIETDIALAQDEDFRARYVNGYEFPDVPRFRQDTAAWESFVRSWCESVSVEAAKQASRSLVTKCVAAVLDEDGIALSEFSAKELAAYLRDNWDREFDDEGGTIGEWVARYFD
ncbi:MAG: hypothetical protein JSR83_01025 [Proteobacteria bacterium]|nr:hypothetical protein [Pseudomonadota bacterium]